MSLSAVILPFSKAKLTGRKNIDRNNKDADICGFKRPVLINHLDDWIRNFSNPTPIFIFLDRLAIGKRNAISMESDLLPNMSETMDEYKKLLTIFRKLDSTLF